MSVLLLVGIALLVLGALVLLRFPDRPGGKIAWSNMEISSTGAGLPLVGLGVLCVVLSATTTPLSISLPSQPGQATGSSGASGDCLDRYLQEIPPERIATAEEGAIDVQLIGPRDAKDQPVAVRLTEIGQPIGAVRLRFFESNELFKVEAVVDAACQEVQDFANASRGGDKRTLQNWDSLRVRLGGNAYELNLGYFGGRVDADFTRVSP